jgi:hypothetical protein
MLTPLKALAGAFVQSTPMTVLAAGIFITALQFVTFFGAARLEGVLLIKGGVGFLNNYGLFSTLIGNAVLPYLARAYYEYVSELAESKAIKDAEAVHDDLTRLRAMVLLQGRFRFVLYGLIFIGLVFWIANTSIHLLGNVQAHWGHKVFDSVDHPIDFYLNRLNNIYAWMIVLPFCGHMMIFCTFQLVRMITAAADHNAVAYDLLNPDRFGGFISVERAHVVLNFVIAIVYVQITLHIETFVRMNVEHALAYAAATIMLLFGNTIFLGGIYQQINKLRLNALNEQKERVYNSDPLSLEILKFYYEHRRARFSIVNFATKVVAIAVPAFVKAAPALFASSTPFTFP